MGAYTGATMGKLVIAINGKRLFVWEGDAAEVESIENQTRTVANVGRITPDTVAQSMVVGIAERGGLMQPPQQVELLALVYFVLNLQTDEAGRPGHIGDYIPLYDFDVDVECDAVAEMFTANIWASPDPGVHQG